jgi:hypothetical protein
MLDVLYPQAAVPILAGTVSQFEAYQQVCYRVSVRVWCRWGAV